MTIQRQYILPNCNLILEGLSTAVEPALEEVMSVVMNAECHFPAAKTSLKGGREFLDGLVSAVNQYGQSFLSGLPARQGGKDQAPSVQIKPGEDDSHHLLIQPQVLIEGNEAAADAQAPRDIQLTTVQLFDLLEAVDQLVADAQTLPDLTFHLKPLSRRMVKPREPVAQRALPAAVGVSTLAAAAIAVALLPVPEVRPPEEPSSETETSESAVPSESANDSLAVDPSDAPEPTVDPVTAAANLDNRPATAPTITDGETLERLQEQLTSDLQDAWNADPSFDETLIFRVGVSETGDILGYKYENDAALVNVDDTPLPRLTYIPVEPEAVEQEPMAQFLATFTPEGSVEVAPVGEGTANTAASQDDSDSEDSDSETAPIASSETADSDTVSEATSATTLSSVIDNEVTDGDSIRGLNQQLYNAIAAEFESGTYPADIGYRVRLNDEGDIVGYEPADQTARDQVAQTPLPGLVDAAAEADRPQVDFQVVFTEDGVIQVNPWKGWPPN